MQQYYKLAKDLSLRFHGNELDISMSIIIRQIFLISIDLLKIDNAPISNLNRKKTFLTVIALMYDRYLKIY